MFSSERSTRTASAQMIAAPRGSTSRRPAQAITTRTDRDDIVPVVPRVLRVTAALGWRLLVVVAALYVLSLIHI